MWLRSYRGLPWLSEKSVPQRRGPAYHSQGGWSSVREQQAGACAGDRLQGRWVSRERAGGSCRMRFQNSLACATRAQETNSGLLCCAQAPCWHVHRHGGQADGTRLKSKTADWSGGSGFKQLGLLARYLWIPLKFGAKCIAYTLEYAIHLQECIYGEFLISPSVSLIHLISYTCGTLGPIPLHSPGPTARRSSTIPDSLSKSLVTAACLVVVRYLFVDVTCVQQKFHSAHFSSDVNLNSGATSIAKSLDWTPNAARLN